MRPVVQQHLKDHRFPVSLLKQVSCTLQATLAAAFLEYSAEPPLYEKPNGIHGSKWTLCSCLMVGPVVGSHQAWYQYGGIPGQQPQPSRALTGMSPERDLAFSGLGITVSEAQNRRAWPWKETAAVAFCTKEWSGFQEVRGPRFKSFKNIQHLHMCRTENSFARCGGAGNALWARCVWLYRRTLSHNA